MGQLFSQTYPNVSFEEENQKDLVFDISTVENEADSNQKVDIKNASIEELSSMIVSDMVMSLKSDLSTTILSSSLPKK